MIIGIIQSCCNPSPLKLRISSLSARIEKIAEIKYSIIHDTNNYFTEPIQNITNTIAYDSLGIIIQAEQESYAYYLNGNVFNQLLACSPSESYELLTDINITSDNDYNANFIAGTNLKDILSIRSGSNPFAVKGISLQSFLVTNYITEGIMFLTFNEPPEEVNKHNITIEFITLNGIKHSTTINDIIIGK